MFRFIAPDILLHVFDISTRHYHSKRERDVSDLTPTSVVVAGRSRAERNDATTRERAQTTRTSRQDKMMASTAAALLEQHHG